MSSSEQRIFPLRQISSYALVVVLSVALTLAVLWTFPSAWLPKVSALLNQATAISSAPVEDPVPAPAIAPDIAPDIASSATPSPQSNRSFVAAAVNRVGPAVVRIDTDRTITTRPADPFFDDPFFSPFFGD
ncbi:MAG TPA: hypothetical protein V6D04_10110, partial [Candidatus Obscuribacterales bacterium]